ncbi:MAG: MFS transporter [Gemmatimonadota bacterium]|nr:MFS transporter [Gemmatimonadota bacterium]
MPLNRACLLALATLVGACTQPLVLSRDDSAVVLAHQLLAAPNPAEPGPFKVRTLTYGSGTDKQRRAFRDSVTLKTSTVDGSKLAAAPDPKQAKIRKSFFGFDFSKMPVNGRVWYPEGEGPFPLVLVVHGNHDMKQFSDPGYAYLGELLASRGFILASVDENFLNGFIRNENDARGWLLLQHLKAWRGFNDSLGTPFTHRVDMQNIALMGHSRGGEAVAVAAAFNRLPFYPDDATLRFDFGFAIKALVAIAPIDGQYKPADQPTPLENVSYLVIHGSHDGDVSSFSGLRQYERIRFTDGKPWFKSAVYVYRANHGQWNTVWGNQDNGPRSARYLDLRGLLSPNDQQRFGKVYIGAFLEATLKGRREYLPLFRDHRVIGQWLPHTMYVTRFQDSGFRALADYHEDVDVTTGSVPGVKIAGESLSVWKEGVVPMRWKDSNFGHSAVWLGWNNHLAGADTTKMGPPAAYALTLSDSLRDAWTVNAQSSVEFSLAPTSARPEPRKIKEDSSKKTASDSERAKADAASAKKGAAKSADDSVPMDLTIEVVDARDVTARLPLSQYGAVRRPLATHVLRRADREKRNFVNTYEIVLQTYVIPLADFARVQPGFDPATLRSLRFRFDRTPVGTVILDDIGISSLDPAFLIAAGSAPR